MIYENGYTLTSFAEDSGVSNWTLHAIFTHKFKNTREDTIYCIAKELKVPYKEMELMINGEGA